MELLRAENLSLGYESRAIVENLEFSVNSGDYLCIVGENGSGKSTLMKTLLGLQKPLKGTIVRSEELKGGDIGYLPQQTLVQKDFPASVKEIVLSGCQGRCGLRPFYNKEEKELAKRNMARMDITDLANRCYRELSGGQQQRVLLARALCATEKNRFPAWTLKLPPKCMSLSAGLTKKVLPLSWSAMISLPPRDTLPAYYI